MKKMKKYNTGITLIALVVTIIMLIILAGVTISMLVGDNSIVNRVKEASESTDLESAKELLKLAITAVKIKSYQTPMTKDDIRSALEEELCKSSEATVYIDGEGYVVYFMGYVFRVSDDFATISLDTYSNEEWDKKSTPEEAFIWASEDKNDGELYHTIIGYKDTLTKYTIVRVPTRCHEMRIQHIEESNTGRGGTSWGVNSQVSRMFDQYLGRDQLGGITKVEIPPTVTILDGAFFTFQSIEEVVLPYTLKEITGASFYGCTNLEKITIPSNVTKIGEYAFESCTNLKEIELPNSIVSVGKEAFWNTQWIKNLNNGEVYIGKVFYKYIGDMPESYTVRDGTKGIAADAFRGLQKRDWGYSYYENTNLKTVTLPNSIEEIGENAFYYCKNLNNVQLPSSLKNIESNAFYYCQGIKSIEFPAGIKKIGRNAFVSTGLQTITTNGNIDTIEGDAFSNTTWLSNQPSGTVYIGSTLYKYKNTGSSNVVVNVKDGTTNIGEGAFAYCSEIGQVNLPDSIIKIGSGAFNNCGNLQTVTMGNNIQEIGYEAFYNDYNLEISELPSALKIIRGSAFYNCKKAFSDGLVINNGTTYIGWNAFSNTTIEKLTIPSSVKTIAQAAFKNCQKLKEVIIDEGLQLLTDSAFENCYELENVELPKSISFYGVDVFAKDRNILQIRVNKKRQNTILEKTLENACPNGTLILYEGEGETRYNITTDNNNVTVISSAYEKQRVYINTKTDDQIVKSFDVNGEHMTGNYFIMPAKDVVISNIEFEKQIVIEQTYENERVLGEFEGAFEENTAVKITLDYESTRDDMWVSIFLFDSNGTYIGNLSNTQLDDKPIYLNDKGIKVKIRNYNSSSNYKFRLIINKTDELEYKAMETPHPYKSNCYYGFTSTLEEAENIFVKFSDESSIKSGDNLSMHEFYQTSSDNYGDRSLGYYYNSSDIQQLERIATGTNAASFLLESKSESFEEEYGIKYSMENYVVPDNVLESSHNYENSIDKSYTKTVEDAEMLRLTFDEKTRFENRCDTLTIYYTKNGSEVALGTYTGTELANKELIIPTNNVRLLLHTDGSVVFYGFRCTVDGLDGSYDEVGEAVTVECPHQYGNSQTYNYEAEINEDIDGIIITFDSQSILETNYDKLYIQDANGNTLEIKTGSFGGYELMLTNTKKVKFKMTTDGSVTKWGFRCTVKGFKLK